jgi:tRNA G18 (ribose-2'-O)-methylase SpoU
MAEGNLVVRRLLRSTYPCHSVLCSDRKIDEMRPDLRPDVPTYLVPDRLMHEIVGFHFHTGVLAIGKRLPPEPLDAIIASKPTSTLIVLPDTNNAENLGAIARTAVVFGADALLLGEQCADPFYRQAVRVSMGTIFSLRLHRSTDILADLAALRDRHGFDVVATVIDRDAEPLASVTRKPDRLALLFGSEGWGLSPDHIARSTRRMTIPMAPNTDSLNVSMSAAIFLYHFTQVAT